MPDTPDIFAALVKSLREIVAAGSKFNREQRDEIRKVVGELTDTLSDSLNLTIIYLSHAKHARDSELVEHLSSARRTLAESFREFKICGGLYNLRDRFGGTFDGVRAVVRLGHVHEVDYLIRDLACGERNVLDFLNELMTWLQQQSHQLSELSVGKPAWNKARKELLDQLQNEITGLEQKRSDLIHETRHLIDRL